MLRGLIKDLISVYIGFRLMLNFIIPLSVNDFFIFGVILSGFSGLFILERLGLKANDD